jgi:16S rRNA (uracil1498-N3)-methyltransferase
MRQYIASSMPDKNGQLTVSGKDFKYLCQVLRLSVGDVIQVRLPNQKLSNMEVFKLQSKQLILKETFCDSETTLVETGVNASSLNEIKLPEIWLFQFLPKMQKMDLIIRQSTECGVTKIIPIISDFSSKDFSYKKDDCERVARWERIVKEARQQSGSAINTTIENPMLLEDALKMWNEGAKGCGFVLHEASIAKKNIFSVLKENTNIHKIGIAVGSEGGISEKEICVLQENDFNLVHFKTNVLRAETASLYGIAAIQTAMTELDEWHTHE